MLYVARGDMSFNQILFAFGQEPNQSGFIKDYSKINQSGFHTLNWSVPSLRPFNNTKLK
jgi:hypothetical protein